MNFGPPERIVLNWCQYEVAPSVELIAGFVKEVETQAKESFGKYEELSKEVHVGEDHFVETYQGLDSDTWDLSEVFREYFPSLQRRSALLSLCGFFEHELNKLCLQYQAEKDFRLSFSDLNGRGIIRAVDYLKKVVGLDIRGESREWIEIKKIQEIRNLIVHQNGKLSNQSDDTVRRVIAYIAEMDSLGGETEVVVKEGFLQHVVSTYWEFFKLIGASIEALEKG